MSFPIVNGVEVLMEAPRNETVDFDNPRTAASTIRNAYWIFGLEFSIAVLFIGQRMYTSAVLLRKFRLDDFLILFAWSCLLYAYHHGLLGVHAWEMSLDDYNRSSLMVMTTTLSYIPTTILSKLTLCVFYYRLSPSLLYQYAVYFTALTCAGSLIGIWFAVLFACKPIAAGWDSRLVMAATCIERPPVYITQAAFGCITDVMLLLLPVPTLIGLQMTTRKKIGVLGLFAIGSITLITSIVRLVLLLPSLANPDQSWSLAEGCLWVIVEANLLIMCGCLPTLRVFLRTISPHILGDRSASASNGDKGSGSNKVFGLRTWGGSNGTKRKFDTLVELEHDVKFDRTVRPDGGEGVGMDTHICGGVSSGGESRDGPVTAETASEEGILQTRTTTVTYT